MGTLVVTQDVVHSTGTFAVPIQSKNQALPGTDLALASNIHKLTSPISFLL
jgi:hypothetical protein